jgi:outer membrane receptor protein involved in Fe transport
MSHATYLPLRQLSRLGCSLSVLLAASALPARNAAAEPIQTAADDGAIQSVTVTAERHRETAQDVGIALTVITPETLQNHGVSTVNDLASLVPSFQATPQFGSGQPGFRLRGVGFDDYASNNSPTVGVYVDEIAFPVPAMTQGLLYDLDQVEVLRGPQGTLYGRNTTGGAVNFITAKPTDTFTGGGSFTIGRYDDARVDAYVSGPLSDSVRVRVAGTTEQGGAWQTNRENGQSLGDKDKGALRVITDIDVTDDVKVEWTLHGSDDQSEQQGLYLITPLATPKGIIPADTNHTLTSWGTSPSFASEIGISPDQKPFQDTQGWGSDVRLDWRLPFATLTDLASYEGLDRREYDNFDASSEGDADVYFASRAAVYSEELRLTSLDGAALKWTGGAYYSYEHLNEDYRSGFIDSLGVNANTPYSQSAKTESIYGQVSPKLTDQVSFDLGVRLEHEQRQLYNFNTFGILANGTVLDFTAANQARSIQYTEPSGVARVNYQFDPDQLFYASASRGVKSGGFTAYNTTDATGIGTQPFQPEKLWAYEIGSKSELDNHRLELNLAGYYYDYTDQQVQSSIVDPVYGQIGKIVNAPKSEILGAEAEITWRPIPPLTLTQSVGYSRGWYDQFDDVGGAIQNPVTKLFTPIYVDRAGQSLTAPKVTYAGSAAYTVGLDQGYALETGFDYSYRGTYFSHFGPIYNVALYWLVDAHVTVTRDNSPWSLTLWGRNIFNENYDITRNFFIGGDNIAAAGEPATFGATVSVKF